MGKKIWKVSVKCQVISGVGPGGIPCETIETRVKYFENFDEALKFYKTGKGVRASFDDKPIVLSGQITQYDVTNEHVMTEKCRTVTKQVEVTERYWE